jgi:hypothetical protein
MTSAANNQGFGNSSGSNPRWNAGPGNFRGPWGHFQWGAVPPWFPPQALKPLLIGATILGFIFWWPIGLALLFVTISAKRACGWGRWRNSWHQGPTGNANGPWQGWQRWGGSGGGTPPSSGNRAFDDYRAETLRRLEEEQKDFGEFLDRLRFAKDKSEFDQFMTERRNRPADPPKPEQPPQS